MTNASFRGFSGNGWQLRGKLLVMSGIGALSLAFVIGTFLADPPSVFLGLQVVLIVIFIAGGAVLGLLLADRAGVMAGLTEEWRPIDLISADENAHQQSSEESDRRIQYYLRRVLHQFSPAAAHEHPESPLSPDRRAPAISPHVGPAPSQTATTPQNRAA